MTTCTAKPEPITTTAITRREAIRRALEVEGWLSPNEAGLLFDMAREANGPIVEIGSWRGRSTVALALGAAAGTGQHIYAIDTFVGVADTPNATERGYVPGPEGCGKDVLRANLAAVGVPESAVSIVPLDSLVAAKCIGNVGLLFVDGNHAYEAVCNDLRAYLPKVVAGGYAVLHDYSDAEPGVPKAVVDVICPMRDFWQERRVDTALVVRRSKVEPVDVLLGFPGRGFDWGPVSAVIGASRHHRFITANNNNGWDDFNALLALALNKFDSGEITHMAMLHGDVMAEQGWLDILIGEMAANNADVVSTVIPIKDQRGLTSTGIGDPSNHWGPWRRLTMNEVSDLPATFCLDDLAHLGADADAGHYLLHNTGCWVADLRKPFWREVDETGGLKMIFDFPTRVAKWTNDKWQHFRESEDWYWSRKLHEAGARTFVTRKVPLQHIGAQFFPNSSPWGTYEHDRDTAHNWSQPSAADQTETTGGAALASATK